jgi:hypothetical protein
MKISGESIGFAQKVSLHTYLKYITFALRKREKGKNIVCSYRSNFQKYFSKKMENKQDFNKKNNPEMLFRKALVARYEYDRAVKGEDNGIEHFLQYLINHNIIENITIQRYTILYAFDEEYEKNDFHKTNTVKALAKQFNLSERQIWTILKIYTKRFNAK